MKTFFLFLVLALSFNAHSSYFQTYCSNGEGTVRIAAGHTLSQIAIVERSWSNSKIVQKTSLFDFGELEIEYFNEAELEATAASSCRYGEPYGMATWSGITSKKVKITRTDGSQFAPLTPGRGLDGSSVEAYLICEHTGNSEVVCDSSAE